jgi:hypothetical protein
MGRPVTIQTQFGTLSVGLRTPSPVFAKASPRQVSATAPRPLRDRQERAGYSP